MSSWKALIVMGTVAGALASLYAGAKAVTSHITIVRFY